MFNGNEVKGGAAIPEGIAVPERFVVRNVLGDIVPF
jgi:hypothetical protein